MVLLGIIGVAVFLLGMKYGDRWEESKMCIRDSRPASTISSRPRFSPAAGAAVIPAALVIEVETVAFP